jgi:hypothetical protein
MSKEMNSLSVKIVSVELGKISKTQMTSIVPSRFSWFLFVLFLFVARMIYISQLF